MMMAMFFQTDGCRQTAASCVMRGEISPPSAALSVQPKNRFAVLARRGLQLACLAASCWFAAPAWTAEIPSNPEPRWWRGNLHTHTLWSDGDGFPEMIAEWYRDRGYHFLALSDHNVLSQGERWRSVADINKRALTDAYGAYVKRFGPHWVETRKADSPDTLEVRLKPFDEYRALVEERGRFIMIQAEEITHRALNRHAIHMNAINIVELITPRDGATVRDTIENNLRAVQESAARTGREVLVHVNHPNYRWGVTAEDLAGVLEERFFEVWNGVEGDNDPGDDLHPSTDEIWDIANALRMAGFGGTPLFAVATDDSHDHHGTKTRLAPGRAWVMVRARHLTPESLIRAMNAGDFYASTGVTLDDVAFDQSTGKYSLQIRGRAGETFVTRFIGTRKGVNLKGKPRLDSEGRVVETTLDYRTPDGPQIGEVFSEVTGTNPTYTLRGDELYVRAVVTSSAPTEVASNEFKFQRAWTQPVGWTVKAEGGR